MKKIFLYAVVGLILVCSACAGVGLQRGLDASGSFISTGRPPITVKPSSDFSLVDCFSTSASLVYEKEITGTVNAIADCVLYKAANKQLVVVISDIQDHAIWDISDQSAEFAHKDVIFELKSDKTIDPAMTMYTRPLSEDPWQLVYNIPQKKQTQELLITRYEWLCNGDRTKIIVEYRELPDQQELEMLRHRAYSIQDLRKRADESFNISELKDPKSAVTSKVKRINIPDSKLAKVLGGTSAAIFPIKR